MSLVKVTMAVYGLALIAMGVQAAFFPTEGAKASMISLYAAGGMGAIVLAMVWLSYSKPRIAYIVTVAIAVLATLRFVPKVMSEQQIYPAGITVALSLITIVVLLSGHLAAMKARKAEEARPASDV